VSPTREARANRKCSARNFRAEEWHSVKGISAVSASENSRKQALFDGRQPSRDLKKAYPNAILPRGTSLPFTLHSLPNMICADHFRDLAVFQAEID
jgi:hypothetical protein